MFTDTTPLTLMLWVGGPQYVTPRAETTIK